MIVSYSVQSNMVSKNKKAADVEITKMALDDLDEVMAIERSSFVTPWSEEMFGQELCLPESHNLVEMFRQELCLPESHNLVARVEWKNVWEVVGYINFLIVVDEVHIRDIAVREDFRMQGVASRLMTEMIKISCHRGVVHATLEVRRANTSARKLYEKFGFVVRGVRPLYYADTREDALIMWADLRERFGNQYAS